MNLPMRRADLEANRTANTIIRATRSWVWAIMADACHTARGRYVQCWNDCFEELGSTEMPKVWGGFMRLLSLEGNAKFLLGCTGCGRPSDDEQALLQCLAAHQQGRKMEAVRLLENWFGGEALWKADALTEAFADQLSLKDLHLPHQADIRFPGEMTQPDTLPKRKLN